MSSTNGPTLPPQAYTREILSVAFQWLQNQPESIKRLAQTPDALVGLFMRAQRFGHSAPETDAPVSSQNFISDLKNLAEGLKQFESPPAAKAPAPQPPLQAQMQASESKSQKSEIKETAPPQAKPLAAAQVSAPRLTPHGATAMTHAYQAATTTPHYQPQAHPQMQQPAGFHIQAPVAASAFIAPTLMTAQLNASAQCMIQEVKTHLNLSSDAEVLNMMVALAYKNIKNLLA